MEIDPKIIFVLAKTVDIFFTALSFLILIRILISWLSPHSRGQIFEFVTSTTDPILNIFRRMNLRIGMIDLSPIVTLLAIDFARMILLRIIFSF